MSEEQARNGTKCRKDRVKNRGTNLTKGITLLRLKKVELKLGQVRLIEINGLKSTRGNTLAD